VLAALGSVAFPRMRLLFLGLWLSAFGALIEVVQAIPALHRDSDVMDWLADSAAILAMLSVATLVRHQRVSRG
jgi:hypothetical protein